MAQADTNFHKVRRMLFKFISFNFSIFLANFHAASRTHRSCHSVSSWYRSSNFGALGFRWWWSPEQTIPSDRFWSRMLAWRNTALVNWTHQIGFSMFGLSTALLSPFFLDLLLGCSSTCRCAEEHFSPNLHPFWDLQNKHSEGSHFSQNELVQVPLR